MLYVFVIYLKRLTVFGTQVFCSSWNNIESMEMYLTGLIHVHM